MMEVQIDVQNIMAIRGGTCNYELLMRDMKKVAFMVVKKYRYPYRQVDDVVSECLVFLFSHVDRIPQEPTRVNSYILALSRSLFRKFLFTTKDTASPEESEFRMEIIPSLFREVKDVGSFQEVIAVVFKSYCFAPFLEEYDFQVSLSELEDLIKRPSFRRLFINAYNRLRYDRIDNVDEQFKRRGEPR